MYVSRISLVLLTFVSLAAAQAKKGAAGPADMMTPFLMMGAILVIMWFFMIRPEQKKQKERQAMLSALKKNQRVITSGGMYGTVQNVKDNSVMVRIDEGVSVEFTKASIVTILDGGSDDGKVDTKDNKAEKKS